MTTITVRPQVETTEIGMLAITAIIGMIQQGIANHSGTPTTFVVSPKQYSAIGDASLAQIIQATGLDCDPSMEAADNEILIR